MHYSFLCCRYMYHALHVHIHVHTCICACKYMYVNIIILSSHQIKSLQGLAQFPVLGSLRLACNELEWAELPRLSHMTLLSLTLSGNPQLDSDPHCEPPPPLHPLPSVSISLHCLPSLSLSVSIAYPLSPSLPSLSPLLILSPSFTLSLCLSLFVDYILYYTDREHVVDILPNLWVLDERLITGIHVYVYILWYMY